MIKRKLLQILPLATILAFTAIPRQLHAQMSDDAVIAYVKEGLASGKSQNEIVKELAVRGVSREQAERLKTRYESETSGRNEGTMKVGAQENRRRMDDGVLEMEAGDMDVIATEITDEAGGKRVFGRNIFTSRNLTFAPSSNLPTPTNYRLGPGDEVIIDIWGTNQATIRQTISPEGYINIDDIGLVNLNGMTVKEADSFMRRKLGQIYSVDGEDAKSEIKLTLGNIRTIQVNLMGEVAVPGTYYLSAFSNLYHALYRAGGVSELGSLRDIQLFRNGKKIATVDVYEFILEGKSPDDIMLEEGDIIVVPTYEQLVDITGNVKRPMFYEMKDGETVMDVIGYAGGFTGDAYKANIRMVRQNGIEYQVYTIDEPEYALFRTMDGDVLTVGAMLDRFANKIEIKGAVYRPGIYQLGNGISTVSQLIAKADGLKGDAFTNRAILHREREDLSLEIIQVDVKGIINGTAPDIVLAKNDVLYIASEYDLKDQGHITVSGEVARPGTYVYADNTTIEDVIMLAGGLLESASTAKIDVSRRVKNPASTEQTDSVSQFFSFSFKDGYLLDGEAGFKLEPYDEVVVRKSPGYDTQRNVRVTGEVVFPGTYALTRKEERLSDLVMKSGGLTQWAYIKGARLQRRIIGEERTRMQSTLEVLDSARDSISIERLDLGEWYFVGIDLQAALENPGSDADLVLREGDVLGVPEYINTVKISGNVMYPNTVTYNPGMSVRDYVTQAGGYGYRSKKSKAYIVYLNGTVARAKRLSKNVVEPGCEIVIPQKRDKDGKLSEILSVATTASSLATMIATIGNIIK